ncbi:MmcQ/YjbR family DNA-binding protein [Pseudorhodobacter sp. E13]|uniref:MmcQ/YjbR family DNA-binding protein n=1 Tax=Pseudorhodobacter sp. E13 TaxID=2487931 RepID=UPI000F8E02B6|nr:MmcQ/YjbR family DNA-binding protein [Pseudorhodobacter sp. E13]RUS63245.1 MmcQ/YjbR family DNA-binding protein [Pseudorhodobacter sp. E13]
MTRAEINAFCASLRAVTHVVQWGGADVWKVGGKVFAITWDDGVTFKASDMAYEILKDGPGIGPAPYMASRGLKWLKNYGADGLSDEALRAHLLASYDMVFAGLSKKAQAALAG